MIQKENKKFRKMFIVTEYAALNGRKMTKFTIHKTSVPR